jgi:hypothetical protein
MAKKIDFNANDVKVTTIIFIKEYDSIYYNKLS